MDHDVRLHDTTVTLFGRADALDHALSDELGRRGCTTHYVTVPTGWLSSTTHAVVRLDTESGAKALLQLIDDTTRPRTHVVAVCALQDDTAESERIDELCRRCGRVHDVSLVWHPALDAMAVQHADAGAIVPTDALAATIVDEITGQSARDESSSYSTRTFEPAPPPH